MIVCSHIRGSHLYILPDPDKWRSDSSHGLSKEEAEEKFKMIQNAADHLLSRFDEASSHHSGSSHAGSDDYDEYSGGEEYSNDDEFSEEYREFHTFYDPE